jgi:hypothetical protein
MSNRKLQKKRTTDYQRYTINGYILNKNGAIKNPNRGGQKPPVTTNLTLGDIERTITLVGKHRGVRKLYRYRFSVNAVNHRGQRQNGFNIAKIIADTRH